MYTSGAYREQILLRDARARATIDAILGRYRTKKPAKVAEAGRRGEPPPRAPARRRGRRHGAAGYFPYKPYCAACEQDLTTVTAYDDDTTELTYTCALRARARPSG